MTPIINPQTGQPFTTDQAETVGGALLEELITLEHEGFAGCALPPLGLLQICGLLQLALRHPDVSDAHRERAVEFLTFAREYFADRPTVLGILDAGDDPKQDVQSVRAPAPPTRDAAVRGIAFYKLLEDAAQAIEHFVIGDNEDLLRIWQPTVDKLRTAAASQEVVALPANVINLLRSRAAWYAEGCPGLDDEQDDGREQYFRDGLAADAAEDLARALHLIDFAVFAGVVHLVEGDATSPAVVRRAGPLLNAEQAKP